jgi:hypothetical protein
MRIKEQKFTSRRLGTRHFIASHSTSIGEMMSPRMTPLPFIDSR